MSARGKTLVVILGLMVAVLLVLRLPLLKPVSSTLWRSWIATTATITRLRPLTITDAEISRLQELTAENYRLRSEQTEYRRLKSQLGAPSFAGFTAVPALTSGHLDAFRTKLVLNRGASDGIVIGAPVVIGGSILVGLISDVSEQTSVVRLMSADSKGIPAQVLDSELAQGLVKGQHLTSLILATVPRDAELFVNDPVLTLGDRLIPHGLLLGTIAEVHRPENEVYQEGLLEIPYQLSSLRAVSVLVAL